MHEFTVQTGKLKITIVAESARDAALEAVQVWEALATSEAEAAQAADAAHRANLDAVTSVRRESGFEKRFPTFNLLATAHGESKSAAWERVLRAFVGGVN